MRYPTLLGAMLVLALVLVACAPAATPAVTEPPATLEPTTEATEAPATEPATEAATEPAATDAPTEAATDAPSVPVTGAATVNVAEVGTFGQALVDGEGRTLYLFTNDTQNSGTSSCTGDCLVAWPPLFTDGDPVAGEGVDAALLGTIALPDGTTQVTYNGWPLYYYAEDTAPGDVNGQGVGGVWFVVSPTGEMIEQ
jgi:predicted lipoprotein with Yx(FWY)xxD motif